MFFSKKKDFQKVKYEEFEVDTANLDHFIIAVEEISGSNLSHKKETLLTRLSNYCKNNQIKSFDDVIRLMRNDEIIRQDIMNLITVNETYFNREISQLKEVVKFAKTLNSPKILCAPCSSGDEVYSLCMLAHENNIRNLEITGIDVNSKAIDEANAGIYDARHLHRLDENHKKYFFKENGDKFAIKQEILPKFSFKVINIFDDELFSLGLFDIILSRNMMIYFDEKFRLKCVENLSKLLKASGRFYIGHADLMPETDIFSKNFVNSIIYYQKI